MQLKLVPLRPHLALEARFTIRCCPQAWPMTQRFVGATLLLYQVVGKNIHINMRMCMYISIYIIYIYVYMYNTHLHSIPMVGFSSLGFWSQGSPKALPAYPLRVAPQLPGDCGQLWEHEDVCHWHQWGCSTRHLHIGVWVMSRCPKNGGISMDIPVIAWWDITIGVIMGYNGMLWIRISHMGYL